MTLIQPKQRLIIWQDPFSDKVCLDKLDSGYNIEKEIAVAPYSDVKSGFAWFANEGHIKPKGWKQVEGQVKDFKQTFNSEKEDYYGSL